MRISVFLAPSLDLSKASHDLHLAAPDEAPFATAAFDLAAVDPVVLAAGMADWLAFLSPAQAHSRAVLPSMPLSWGFLLPASFTPDQGGGNELPLATVCQGSQPNRTPRWMTDVADRRSPQEVADQLERVINGEMDFLATGPLPERVTYKWQAPFGAALEDIELLQDYVGQLASWLLFKI